MIIWGALILDTGRFHARAIKLIKCGTNLFATTGAFIASSMTLVHGTPALVSVLMYAVSAPTLWYVVLHPKLLNADLISYLEETTVLHLVDKTPDTSKPDAHTPY